MGTALIENNPEISIVMSVYNGEKYLYESVRSILGQTYENFEFIIIDDGSNDKSGKIISEFDDNRIKLIKRTNHGLAASLNYAVKNASGRIIARMDADDIAYPERLSMQYKYLESNEECVMVGSNADIIDKAGNYLYTSKLPADHKDISILLKHTSPFFHSSAVFRKEIFEKCGGYYEPVKQHVEDFILWNKFLLYGKLANIEKPLMKYRLTPGGLANRSRKQTEGMIKIANDIITGNPVTDEQMKIFSFNKSASPNKKKSGYYSNIGCIQLYRNKDRGKALYNFIASFRYNPLSLKSAFLALLSIMPEKIIDRWKIIRGIN